MAYQIFIDFAQHIDHFLSQMVQTFVCKILLNFMEGGFFNLKPSELFEIFLRIKIKFINQ